MTEKPEVVIAGVAGAFPECQNVTELEEALFKKAHLVTDDGRKWKQKEYGFPTFCGKVISHEKFDTTFFNVPFSFASVMDPIVKKCLETSVEAIIDAGVNPSSLSGSSTAVYVTYDGSEMELTLSFLEKEKCLVGVTRSMTSNRLSFALNLHGPSYTLAGGFGAFFHLIDRAKEQLEERIIPAAIVVCVNYIMSTRYLAVSQGMGLAVPDGKCRSFDNEANGYSLSDSCVAFYMQRADDARRNWATVLGADARFFGTKEGNVTSFDPEPVKHMLRMSYAKWAVDPSTVDYIEADGCGVRDRDEKEMDVIASVFCKRRKKELLLGSLKSNMGHAESAAGGAGAVKAIIALNRSKIPPNIFIDSPISQLSSSPIRVVTETTPLNGELVAVNSIGFFGSFGHLLLRKNPKKTSSMKIKKSFPQILLLSSRNECGIDRILDLAKSTEVTPEFAALLNGVFWKKIKSHMYRAYTITSSSSTTISTKKGNTDGFQRPIWYVFSGMGSQWNGMGSQLLEIPIFKDAIDRCDRVLKPFGVDINYILTTSDQSTFENIMNSFVGITAVQIGLVEILRALKIEPDGMLGHSMGELGCAYVDNCLTLEQTILATYARGKASLEADLVKGMMASVGIGYCDITNRLPETLDVACRNSDTNCTVSGPAADVKSFVKTLGSEGVFARAVNVSNIAYHSRYIQPAGPILMKYLKEIIPNRTERSKRWISSSIPKQRWDTELAKYGSAEYYTNNLLSPVLFDEALKHIPKNAVVIEIAPHGLLQSIIKGAVPESVANVPLAKRPRSDDDNAVEFLLNAIGQLYLLGLEPDVAALYPPVSFPVPCDTPSLQPFVAWEHTESYCLADDLRYWSDNEERNSEKIIPLAEIKGAICKYEEEGIPVLPLSLFLVEIWKLFGEIHEKPFNDIPIVFEDVHIHSELDLSKKASEVWLSILPGTGLFIVNQVWRSEKGASITETSGLLNGIIKIWENPDSSTFDGVSEDYGIERCWAAKDLERCLTNCAESKIAAQTKGITEFKVYERGAVGKIKWNSDWVLFFDASIKANLLKEIQATSQMAEASDILFIRSNPKHIESENEGSHVTFCIDSAMRRFECKGITVDGFKTRPRRRKTKSKELVRMDRLHFVPYGNTSFSTEQEFLRACLEIIVENSAVASASSTSCKVDVYVVKYGCSVDPIVAVLGELLRSQDNDFNIDLKFNYSSKNKNPPAETVLAIVSGVKEVILLPSMENAESAYLLATLPRSDSFDSMRKYAAANGHNYTIIYEQVFEMTRLGLMKKANPYQKLRTCQVTKGWRSSLGALELNGALHGENIILVMDKPPFTNPMFTRREILKETGSNKIRCFFLLDNSAPVFSLKSNFFKEQIERGLVMNVLKDGQWGSYRRQPTEKVTPNDLSLAVPNINRDSKDVQISFIGLNQTSLEFIDTVQLSTFDYSGVTSTGEHVIGLGYTKGGAKQNFQLDPVFQWTVPSTIPLKEATSIPYAYLMAHFIMDKIIKMPITNTVLVHSGHTPVGMACINVSLTLGYTVYTTVPNEVAYNIVTSTFPQLPASRISNSNSEDFYVPLMMETNGRGADIVISDLPRRQMLSSWKCIGVYGCFINLNADILDHNAPLPMGKFNDSNGYYCAFPSSIVNMGDEQKRRIRRLVGQSLMSGEILLIPCQVLSGNDLNQLQSSVKAARQRGGKILASVNEDSKTLSRCNDEEVFAGCDPQRTYLVLSCTLGKAMPVIEWLLSHGAKKLMLAPLTEIGRSVASRKINELTAKHEASLLVTAANKAHTRAGANDLLEQATSWGQISTVFTISLDQNASIVSNVKESIKHSKLNCRLINIQSENSLLMPEGMISVLCASEVNLSSVLDAVMASSDNTAMYVVGEQAERGKESEKGSQLVDMQKMREFLPSSVDEIVQIGEFLSRRDLTCNSQNSAEFVRTESLAPLEILHKDVRPVFIIPAICETQMRPLISRLIYPCFVAHIHPDVTSTEKMTSQLLQSMMHIQKQGPYTIVAETWSGAVAMALSRLLSDAGKQVSLFLFQGVPSRMRSFIPAEDVIDENLMRTLFGITEDEIRNFSQNEDESQKIQNAVQKISNEHSKAFAVRAFRSILKNLEILRGFTETKVLKDTLILFEIDGSHQLQESELKQMSEKKVELIILDCKCQEELLANPLVLTTIHREAPFSWSNY